jgi:hypothetical protein
MVVALLFWQRTDLLHLWKEARVAQQHKDFEAALADLKGQIQKVSAQLELSRPAPQTVAENQ